MCVDLTVDWVVLEDLLSPGWLWLTTPKVMTNRSIRSCFSRQDSVEMLRLSRTERRSFTFHFWRSCRVKLPEVRMLHFLHWRWDRFTFCWSCITQLAQKYRPQSLHSFYNNKKYDSTWLNIHWKECHNVNHYSSEKFFLYETTIDKWTTHQFITQNELHRFLLLHFYDVLARFENSWHLIG